jgi:hypothetical protein
MEYAPKLKTAMEEIKAVLKKHDIAGFVVLHTPGFSEFLNHLVTSYSCAEMEPSGDGVHIQLKASQLGPEKAERIANDTYNMISHFAEQISRHAVMYLDMDETLTEAWRAEKEPGSGSSHIQQNN